MSADLVIPEEFVTALRAAQNVVVLTGAGISAESGVPTFRDAQTGLWAQYDPMQLATPEAFRRDPDLVWRWYMWRRELTRNAAPNPGHEALVRLAELVPSMVLVTQNVDGLHHRAGSQGVLELHGNIVRTVCFECRAAADTVQDLGNGVPRCSRCNGLLRPDVVWFGEALPMDTLARAAEASGACDLFVSVGTSSLVYPAAGLPYQALTAGAPLVEINPEMTPLTGRATFVLRAPAGVALPALLRATWP
jgi:NAD-dependent deacetylase